VLLSGRDGALLLDHRVDQGALAGCLFRTRRVVGLAYRSEGEYFFPRPALAMAGPLVAYASVDENQSGPLGALVIVRDLRHPTFPFESFPFDGKVGSIVTKTNGAVAWIQCLLDPHAPFHGYGNPRPECVKSGGNDTVFKHDRTTPGASATRVLDSDRGVDPRSLELHGSRLTWRDGGALFSSSLR
jgi:hypothetical protein